MTVANTPAYYVTEMITTVKSLIVQASVVSVIKLLSSLMLCKAAKQLYTNI